MAKVRLVKEFPLHGTKGTEYANPRLAATIARFRREVWEKWQDVPIAVGDPKQAEHWNCDSGLIWPVAEPQFILDCNLGKTENTIWLCHHMFETD